MRNEDPTYEKLINANKALKEKLRWLEGIYDFHQSNAVDIQAKFLSNINHEIRTPMNAISGFSNLLLDDTLSDCERNKYVNYISLNSKALLKVMENIIDLTLVESNKLSLRREVVSVDETLWLVHRTIKNELIRPLKYPVAFLMTIPEKHKNINLNADSHWLKRILDYLLTNAITVQKKGVVEMKLDLLSDREARISVICNKNEMLKDRAKMFFEDVNELASWYNYGDKIGMSYRLAREVVNKMDGKVILANIGEKRMGFCIDLPVMLNGHAKRCNVDQNNAMNV